jgi:hypothetical protein
VTPVFGERVLRSIGTGKPARCATSGEEDDTPKAGLDKGRSTAWALRVNAYAGNNNGEVPDQTEPRRERMVRPQQAHDDGQWKPGKKDPYEHPPTPSVLPPLRLVCLIHWSIRYEDIDGQADVPDFNTKAERKRDPRRLKARPGNEIGSRRRSGRAGDY